MKFYELNDEISNISFKQVIEDIQVEDKKVKEKFIHVSQKDAAKGFGGKFGVQKDRVDQSAVGFDYHASLSKHESQKGRLMIPVKEYYCCYENL